MLCSVFAACEEVGIRLQHPTIHEKSSNVAVLKTFHPMILDFQVSFWSVHILLNYIYFHIYKDVSYVAITVLLSSKMRQVNT